MGRRIIALTIKEFLALLKDKKSRTVIIVPPLVQLLVFSYAATFDLNRVPYAVYNEDPGSASRDLLAAFTGSTNFREVARISSNREIAPLINGRKVLLVLHIGPQFTRDLLLRRPAELQVIVDGRNSNTAMVVLSYVRSIVTGYNDRWIERRGLPKSPARLVTRFWFNQNLESRWFIVPGVVGILTLVVTILVTGLSVAREREQGTFDQLLVTPLRPVEILFGKALPGFIIGLGEASLIMLLAVVWFEVPLRGNILTLYTGIVLFLLSAVGVGLMISSLAVTQQQGLLGAFLFIVPSIILSGFATPIANMPEIVQELTLLNPLRYYLVVLRSVFLENSSFTLLIHQFWPMAVIGVVCLASAAWLFRHRMH